MTKQEQIDKIKKSLAICVGDSCEGCAYHDNLTCIDTLKNDARKCIIKQENEIEKLKNEFKQLETNAEILARGVRDLNHENYELTEKIKQAQIDTMPMKLIQFVEQFVTHNSTVELYSVKLTPEKTINGMTYYNKYFNKLETVMDWQITEPDDCEYYKAHPGVKPCKYRYCNVEEVIGLPNPENRIDLIGIVVEVENDT